MKKLYYLSTTVPLDANGNPTGPHAPTVEETLTAAGLFHLFLGSRFTVEADGTVKRLESHEKTDLPLEDTVNFHPKLSRGPLLSFISRRQNLRLIGRCELSGKVLCIQKGRNKLVATIQERP